jgi:hypothetical protein
MRKRLEVRISKNEGGDPDERFILKAFHFSRNDAVEIGQRRASGWLRGVAANFVSPFYQTKTFVWMVGTMFSARRRKLHARPP